MRTVLQCIGYIMVGGSWLLGYLFWLIRDLTFGYLVFLATAGSGVLLVLATGLENHTKNLQRPKKMIPPDAKGELERIEPMKPLARNRKKT